MTTERFTVTDASYRNGLLVPGSDLITADITINNQASGANCPHLKDMLESAIRTVGFICSAYGTNVYDEFNKRFDELMEYAGQLLEGVEEPPPPDLLEQLNLFKDPDDPDRSPGSLN
jgi:hypothetical protein